MNRNNVRVTAVRCTIGLFFLIAFACATSQAALVVYDGFNYSGTGLAAQNGGTGWSGPWFNTATTDNSLSNDGVSLQYPLSFEPPLIAPTPSGSHVKTGGVTASSSRLLAETIPLNVDGTVRFVSALFRKNVANGATTADNVLLEFTDSSANRRWGFGIEGAGDKPWLNANGSTSPATAVTVGDTYFMVAKIVSSAAGADQAFLKVFGTGYGTQVPAAEPTTWDATLTEITGAILDRIRIRIDNGNSLASPGEIDEIRIGSSWADVVSVPESSSFILLAIGAISLLVIEKLGSTAVPSPPVQHSLPSQ
jgi:hypothetical protein